LASIVPWALVFAPTTLCGGDNPAHPVLMLSMAESVFSHLSLIHYSYRFWGGFEAFQFYFVLPYLSGAILSRLIHPGIAFKLVTLFGIIGLPVGFYWMAAFLGLSRPVRAVAVLLSIPFLFTKAHVMWGGNIYSALAGMIGNAWAFVFFALAFGAIVRAHRKRAFSLWALTFCVLASLSHFYAFLMLAVLFAALALYDFILFVSYREMPPWRTYLIGVFLALLISWWLLPLLHYAKFSSDLGGNWGIQLLKTFTLTEKIFFGFSIVVGIGSLIRARFKHPAYGATFLFLGIFLFLFFFNRFFNSTIAAFEDVRLWPSIYFACYLLIILAVETLYQLLPPVSFPLLLVGFYFLIPPQNRFTETRDWMRWNYRGLERSPGWNELKAALQRIEKDPPGRISYEAYGNYANGTFGSVRAMELLPYVSPHDVILGGIVNSASYAGIGYFLQCLMSNEGAGWPPGSVMPAHDIARGVDMMKALGVQYHIAFRRPNRLALDHEPELEKLYDGNYLGLYRLKKPVRMVEVFSEALPVYQSAKYRSTLLNLPRWDAMRNAGIIFSPDSRLLAEKATGPTVALKPFINYLLDQWGAKKRVFDMSWQNRQDRISNKVNLYLFSRGQIFDPGRTGTPETEFMIADRGFDPELFMLKGQEKYTEVAIPLLRTRPGRASLQINGRGYRAFVDEREIPLNTPAAIDFRKTATGSDATPSAWVILKPEGKFHYAEPRTDDPEIRSGFPEPAMTGVPEPITDACQVQLVREFHRMVLHTRCPGKPHLIKYSYFPKWKSDVPIFIGTNGFMVLTPKQPTTVLVHNSGVIDILGQWVTALTALALGFFYWFCRESFPHKPARILPKVGTFRVPRSRGQK